MRPLFSCVVPVKGKRPFFDEAVASLRSQGLGGELEIIVQDADVEPDAGQSDALNRGFAKARGMWFFWLNADDVLRPETLRKVAERIHSSSAAENGNAIEWIVGDQLLIDARGRIVGCSVGCAWHDFLYRHVLPQVHGPSSFFRRELFERVGGFDPSLHYCMDADLWLRFKAAGARYERINGFLWCFRQWEGSKTQSPQKPAPDPNTPDELQVMLRKNSFLVTRQGVWLSRFWRLLCGSLPKQWWVSARCGCGDVLKGVGRPS